MIHGQSPAFHLQHRAASSGSWKDIDLLNGGSLRATDGIRLVNDWMPAVYLSTGPAVLVVTDGMRRFAR
jgi:hypothetical protein